MRSPSRDVTDDRERQTPAAAVDWRQAAAARQPGQRPGTRTPTVSEEPAGEHDKLEGLHRPEQETIALYKSWVRRGEHRDVVWKNGLVKLGDQLVRIKNGQVTIVSPPSKKVAAMAAAAAPATRTSVQARAQRKLASYAKLQALVRKQVQEFERSAAVAARRDRQYQTSTASCMHLLIACYDRLTLPQEKKFSRRVLAYHALLRVRNQLEANLKRSPTDEEWAQAAELSSVTDLRRGVEHGLTAKCRLVEGNIRLVVSIAKNYRGMGLDFEDVIQAGIVGLLKGVDRYDITRGFRFSTYATYWIRQSIQLTIRRDSRLIRLPAYAWDRLSKIARARAKLAVELGRAASLEETAAEVHLSTAQVRLLLAASQEVASLEQGGPALLNQMLANGQRLAEFVEKREDPNMDKDPYEMVAQEGAPQDIERILSRLEEEEALVLELRLGLRGQAVHNVKQTSRRASIPYGRVANIQTKAIDKLKGPYKSDVEDLLAV